MASTGPRIPNFTIRLAPPAPTKTDPSDIVLTAA
jgi:hypothetical protein